MRGLVVRLEIDGKVVKDREVDLSNADLLSREDAELCADADAAGKTWFLEVTDPDGCIEPLRMSNDRADPRIKDPRPATPATIRAAIDARAP